MSQKTSTGFEFELDPKRLNNYELVEALGDLEENNLVLPKVVRLLLGKEQTKALKDHLRDDEGFVDTEQMTAEIREIFELQQDVKN